MIVPFQTSGAAPPLYLVHGLGGLMPLGRLFARFLGPNQPLYGINANGLDGRETMAWDYQAMTLAYVNEILDAQPGGPLLVGGMCDGGFLAMDVARELQARGREIGPLILLDPPGFPIIFTRPTDPRDPAIASRLYQQVRARLLDHDPEDLPFPVDDEQRVHLATVAGVNALVALVRQRPRPFPGEAMAILSSESAVAFFHPQMPWTKLNLLPRISIAHVLSCNHREIFRSAQHKLALAHVLKFVVENAVRSTSQTEGAMGSIFAPA